MIRKLRLKFVAISMALVTAVMAACLLAVSASVSQTISHLSEQVLRQVIREDGWRKTPPPGIQIGGDQVLLPYFTVNVWPGRDAYTAYVTGGTYDDLEDTQELAAVIQDCLSQEKPQGVIEDYRLRYLRQDNELYFRLAFVDMSMEQAMLSRMMRSYLAIAFTAFWLLLGVSVLLARRATRPVDQALRRQRQFLSDASHELKTPLTVILSNAELLNSAGLTGSAARWVDNISSESRRMKNLVEQMLTLARGDRQLPAAAMGETSLSEAAEDCALAFEPVAFEAGRLLRCDLAEDVTVLGEGEKLRQLIAVLLDNAVKYSGSGSEIWLVLKKTDRQAILSVENTGEEIPPEQLAHLFERFYRADSSRGEKSGFGLGLSIAQAIAQEHKGTLRAESAGKNIKFILTLPVRR